MSIGYKDQIVEEVRKLREELAAKHKYDVFAILAAAKERQLKSDRNVVSLPAKKLRT